MAVEPIIRTKNLEVIYNLGRSNQVNALGKIDLEIYPGEFIIFFGPSGCGKSTLLYSIAGLERGVMGDIFIDGKNFSDFKKTDFDHFRQSKMGMVFQAFHLIPSLNILSNIVLPQFSLGTSKQFREEKARQLLEYFGIAAQEKKLPPELSGGQQQRVAIARALMNDPDIIFADEPTGNLDSKSTKDVLQVLYNLNAEQKKTVILVTHSPDMLSYAHRVFYIKDGKIIDVKVNKAPAAMPKSAESKPKESVPTPSRDLELLAKTYTNLDFKMENSLLVHFKAQQIVNDVMTEMTSAEIDLILAQVEFILSETRDEKTLKKYLDDNIKNGGLGLDKRTAAKLTEKILAIIDEIKLLKSDDRKAKKETDTDHEVKQLRHYLFDIFDVKISNSIALARINEFIRERLDNKIDAKQLEVKLDLPISKKGAGLDSRLAKKLARRIDLVLLGKYTIK